MLVTELGKTCWAIGFGICYLKTGGGIILTAIIWYGTPYKPVG